MSLNNIRADPVGDNVAVIDGIKASVTALPDDTPFVLFPVRIETRFVRREVARTSSVSGTRELAAPLTTVVESVEKIATTDFSTNLKGMSVKEQKKIKRNVELKLYTLIEQNIATATEAATQVQHNWRDAADGNAAEAKALKKLLERGSVAFNTALESIARLRSPFQRARLQNQFKVLHAFFTPTLDQLNQRLVPALAMVDRLRARKRLPTAEQTISVRGTVERTSKSQPMPFSRLIDSAESFERVRTWLSETITALVAASGTKARLDRTSQLAKEITDSIGRAIADVDGMALLPGDYKTELLELVTKVHPLIDELATAVEKGTAGGGEVLKAVAVQGKQLRAAVAKLEKAISAVRSDDRSLDEEVPATWRDADIALMLGTVTVYELWVRIFPDDIAVETHEPALTNSELESGATFWQETNAAGGNETLKRGAWRVLALKHGSNRAAWIALHTEPIGGQLAPPADATAAANVLDALTTFDKRIEEVSQSEPGKRLTAVMRAAKAMRASIRKVKSVPPAMKPMMRSKLEVIRAKMLGLHTKLEKAKPERLVSAKEQPLSKVEPILQEFEQWLVKASEQQPPQNMTADMGLSAAAVSMKAASWSTAPHSSVLPNRFVVITANAGVANHVVACAPVRPDLKLGLDPDPAHAAGEQFTHDANGNLIAGDSIRWMVNFDEAISVGMGVKIVITAEQASSGFDRVFVLGVRSDNRDQGRAKLEALLDNHHYTKNGLAVLPIGTPTNNAETETAGYKTSDEPDESYAIERGGPLFNAAAPSTTAADGLRLARALGVGPDRLTHVANAGGQDVNEAMLMNRVLWPATFGSFLEEFFGSLMPVETRAWIAEFALANVTARGSIPTFRVGAQPYGVLPATAFSAYVPATGRAMFPDPPRNVVERRALFNRLLGDVLLRMNQDWGTLRSTYVKHAHSPGVTNFQQHFLDMLGLQATSATSSYRLSLNCARRHPPTGSGDLLDFGVPAAGSTTAASYGPVALLQRFPNVFRDALRLGPGELIVNGEVGPAFDKAYKRLLHCRAYEVRHLKEPKPLTGLSVGPSAATWIPQLLGATPAALIAEANTSTEIRPLLYLLIRHALLNQLREATLGILATEGMLTDVARRLAASSDEFLVSTLSQDFAVTQWNYLFALLSSVDGRFGIVFPNAAGTLYNYLRTGTEKKMAAYLENRGNNPLYLGFVNNSRHAAFKQALINHANDTQQLVQIPQARLEQLLFEHLDMVGHRLDAWLTGLATERLGELRRDRPLGTYIGAYGWVENLRPDTSNPLASGVPPELITDAQPIYTDVENQGFIHGPSLNHAVAAAILRSGYLSEAAQPDVENRMAVNLSSRRVRLALDLIDGVRAGNDLGSLLGYQFERFLHEAYANEGVTLDDLIAPLRRAFPSTVPVDESLSSPEASRQIVVDGLALHQTVQEWIQDHAVTVAPGATVFDILYAGGTYALYPFGLQAHDGQVLIPPTTDATSRRRLDVMLRALDNLADAVDAVADLVVSEGVYQIAQGNHVRAAAAVAALAQGKAPPRPEIVDTPRSGTLVSQRLFLHLPPIVAFTNTRPAGWQTVPETPRSIADPSLNNWLGALLGSAQNLRARIFNVNGTQVSEVSAGNLQMQPVDLLALLGPGFDKGLGELAARILDTRRPNDVNDAAPPPGLRLELQRHAAWNLDIKSFVEIAPLLESVWEMLTRGRAATAHDWVLEEKATDNGALLPGSNDNELSARVTASLNSLRSTGVALMKILSNNADQDPALLLGDPKAYVLSKANVYMTTVDGRRVFRDLAAVWARRNELINALAGAANFGVTQIDPPVAYPSRDAVLREVFEKIETAFIEVATRVQRTTQQLAALPATGPRTDKLLAAAKSIFGESFVTLPQFQLRNSAVIFSSLAANLRPVNDPSLDGWLNGVAAVRANAARLARVITLADAFGVAVPSGAPVQLPHVAGDPWLGGELPANFNSTSDRLSLVVFGSSALNTSGGANVGVLVDQWTEIIPSREETSGVAIHYDQPDAVPPQCVLLAVPPERRNAWSWNDLVNTLDETLELAKNRALELEHLHNDLYGQILPGISGELVPVDLPTRVGGITDSRVILDFAGNNPAAAPV